MMTINWLENSKNSFMKMHSACKLSLFWHNWVKAFGTMSILVSLTFYSKLILY